MQRVWHAQCLTGDTQDKVCKTRMLATSPPAAAFAPGRSCQVPPRCAGPTRCSSCPPSSPTRRTWAGLSGETQVCRIQDRNRIRSPTLTGRMNVVSSISTDGNSVGGWGAMVGVGMEG